MIQFYTWKAAGINLASAVGTVRAAESVRDLGRAVINFHHCVVSYPFIVRVITLTFIRIMQWSAIRAGFLSPPYLEWDCVIT